MLESCEKTHVLYYVESDVLSRIKSMAREAAIAMLAQSLNVPYKDAEKVYGLFVK